MSNSASAWRAAVLQASLACAGASCSGESATRACPSLQSLPECTAERSDYGTPQVILSADELGTGFLLSFVNEAIVVGQRDGEFRGVLVDGQLPRTVFDLEFQGSQVALRMQDAAWEGWFASGTPRFYVLACAEASCELYQASQVDEFGLPLGPVQGVDTPLERGWSVHGLFFPGLEPSALCAFGDGIQCLSDTGWVESLSRTESGDIAQVLSGLALSVDGRLFRLDQQTSNWTEVPGVSNVARLTTGGALLRDGSFFPTNTEGDPTCVQEGVVAAGGRDQFLGSDGLVARGQRRGTATFPCRSSVSAPLGGELLGETQLFCGLSQNWAVLTTDSLVGLMGPIRCAVK